MVFQAENGKKVITDRIIRPFKEFTKTEESSGLLLVLCTILALLFSNISFPRGLTWTHIVGVSALAGIGFTMSLFIGGLAITDSTLTIMMKFSILLASLVSVIIGLLILSRVKPVEIDIEEFDCR